MKRPAVPNILIFSIMLIFSACSTEYDAHYDKLMQSVYSRGQFNGNILVLKEGKIVYRGSFGIADINTNDSLHLKSRFRLASVSKQFTAAGIMELAESGALNYDQDLRDFFPELPYEGISIRHLLNHTSGIPDYERLLNKHWKPELDYRDPQRIISGNEDIIRMLAANQPPIRFEPGDKYEYSNTGYVLLASIIERVSGQTFAEYLKEQIFDPTGMKNTCVYKYVLNDSTSVPERVYGFKKSINGKDMISTDYHYINPVQGDGGVYSTVDDMLKWDRVLYGDKILSEFSKKEAFSPAILNNGDTSWYGFGWGIKTSPTGKKVLEHSGGWVGFRTYFYREIEENNCIIILTNHSSQYMWDIVNELKHILHDQE
ncbi:MAG: serine hydrolase domain-containing protein [Candidatus Marinimicrobia bacterium]|nr:serine hydrolase domain-containing protein [Candidatus Neomarinimicrobiota bacterium]